MGLMGERAVAIVGVGAVMPDAPDATTFWQNIVEGRYSISETPPERWDPALYYDPDPQAPDKTYSRIGGWVRAFDWQPLTWRMPIPPRVDEHIDEGQKWAIACSRAALLDAGWPDRPLDGERTAIVIGNAMAGEKHYETAMRIQFPEFARELEQSEGFRALPEEQRRAILEQAHERFRARTTDITEDTMPGELGNILAGRVANLLDLRGPNYVVDAACASALAAMDAAVEGLLDHEYDVVLTGGVDRNMGVAAFVKFCKIGALSATGTRPYGDGADGFVMGEGAAMFLLKRLADAERDGDRIYAVLCGLGGSSDGRGKGITAPNPVGQRLAVERAWATAGLDPRTATYVEGHGTSTAVGDVVELQALTDAFGARDLPAGAIPLGSVKSNIGHLKAAAGAAGLFKTILALHHKVLPPSINAETLNPNLDWSASPFRVNHELDDWKPGDDGVRRAGVSAFGFGGTNFHAVLEEYVPGRWNGRRSQHAVEALPERIASVSEGRPVTTSGDRPPPDLGMVPDPPRPPLRGLALLGAAGREELAARIDELRTRAEAGHVPAPARPDRAFAEAPMRLAIDHADPVDLVAKLDKAARALASDTPAAWRMLRQQGVFLGQGAPPPTAFLYTGQGSQYVNMLKDLRAVEPIVADTFEEADRVMTPLLGRPLSDFIFIEADDPAAVALLEQQLLQTEITQPAVLATDLALTRLLATYGIRPDMVMGHSLGEYGALVAAGALSFEAALEAVSARGQEMAHLQVEDNGAMAAVFAPLPEIESIVGSVAGYAVIANVNSTNQAVVGGATAAVERAIERFQHAGHTAVRLPVSHAFHTSIVAPASEPLRRTLDRLDLRPPHLPIVANVDGRFYPTEGDVRAQMLDILGRQVASPVQFVAGLHTLYDAGARVFVEVGPKRALHGFVEDVLGTAHDDVLALFTNHPKGGDVATFNQALAGLYAAGFGADGADTTETAPPAVATPRQATSAPTAARPGGHTMSEDRYAQLGHLFADFLEQGRAILEDRPPQAPPPAPVDSDPVVVTGVGLGLPGTEKVFDDGNIARLLDGEQFVDVIPARLRDQMLDKRITRLVKREDGNHTFETIDHPADVIRLAGRRAAFDLAEEFGIDPQRVEAFDKTTELAIGAGLEAMRDAGIPLVQHYRTTSVGSQLPDRWLLPDDMRDDTGVIFASAFPGMDRFVDELERYYTDLARRDELADLERVRARMVEGDGAVAEVDRRIHALRAALEREPYAFDRRFLFRVIAFGHAQFAELIGARGPNTQVNAACASTTQAVGVAEDWIRTGRCRRVIVISADDVTNDRVLPWAGSGFLATGAAATDDVVEEAALPFDNRRHGMLLGMGAAALVVESAASVRERGIRPIAEVLATVFANSAFHGTRLDVDHIRHVADQLLEQAEARGLDRNRIADRTVFVSHETYTPARGGSASAEVNALRHVFGDRADDVVIANTKGYTGHAMAAGVEDVLAVRALETGIVPPIPNHKEPDPELGHLNLSMGGRYDVDYAVRLGAGFGSQIAMTLLRWVPRPDGQRTPVDQLGYAGRIADQAVWQAWLRRASGQDEPRLEVVDRQLRVTDVGARPRPAPTPQTRPEPAPSTQPARAPETRPEPVHAMVELAPEAPPRPTEAVPPPAPVAEPVDEPVAEPVAEPAPTEPAASFTAPAGVDPVEASVVATVAEMTGYPADLLDLDLDLEADLGVDTVKQAEVFAELRRQYGIARDESLQLRDFPTLTHVVGFVRDRAMVDLETSPAVASAPPPAGTTAGFAPPGEPVEEPAAPAGVDPVEASVVATVAELTGYPADLLDLDLDLEADLGVDTVKQAEVFATLRSEYGIPRDESLQLRDFPTLTHVVGFVRSRATTGIEPAVPVPPTTTVATPDAAAPIAPPAADLVATDAVPRRVPLPVRRPDLGACVPTGIRLGADSRVVVMPDAGGVGDALVDRLADRAVAVLRLDPQAETAAVIEALDDFLAAGPVQGVYWLPALDVEADLADLDHATWREALRRRVKLLHATMRHLYDEVATDRTFLVSATRLGGFHGYDEAGATAPLGGAVAGFSKAYKRERLDVLVKCVDVPPSRRTAALAELLIAETETDPGCVEVGYGDDQRWTVGLREAPFVDEHDGMALTPDTTFLVTGAAGSIVSAITADLAAASGGTFHLLDLTPAPDPDDPDLQAFGRDRDGLKTTIADRLKAAGERPTPVAIDRELGRLERLHAALSAIRAVRDAGGTVHYHSVDLTDHEAVAAVMEDVRTHSERIDVLLHAAGLEISHALPDKPAEQFALVFDVKSDGWFNVLHGARDLPIGATVCFSSIAGRFGNAGQTDYSAANDLLCKITSSFRRTRPDTRGLVVDWTAWGGIGMATRGSIPKVMEMAGIDLLPPEAGVPWIRRELTASDHAGEVVVAGSLGMLAAEWHATGGRDLDRFEPPITGPMIGRVAGGGLIQTVLEVVLDPAAQPFLDHHRIDGTPVLPGVMGMEAFAEAARALAPDLHVVAVEDVSFEAPFKFYRDQPRTVRVHAVPWKDGDQLVVDCRLVGERTLATQEVAVVTTHFSGRVRLSATPPEDVQGDRPASASGTTVHPDDLYRVYFHGPAYRVVEEAWRDGERCIGRFAADLPAGYEPADRPTQLAPRLVELCFQTAGVWEIGTTGRMALPASLERMEVHGGASEAGGPFHAVATPREDGAVDAFVVDADGMVRLALTAYRTVELPAPVEEERRSPLAAAMRS